ncbi:MAG: NACHT domain-containing protein, partial [Anaerolineales bacterium]
MESRRLVLLGDPGSGKSTFAQHLCLCLAGARLDPQGEWPGYLRAADAEGWELAFYPFPLLIRLRLFAHDADCLPDDPKQMGRAEHLLKFIQKEAVRLGRPELAGRVLELLENGDALVVLDGLDEVTHPNPARADADRRRAVAQVIGHFAHTRFPHARLLVTCREKQYPLNAEGEPAAPWKLPGFPVVKLADFDPEQIESFVAQWFDELQARGRVKDTPADRAALLAALAARRELTDLAPKPILLTQMALVHATEGKLPDSRIKLYEKCIELLLWDWERLRAVQSGRQGETADDFLREHCRTARQAEVQAALEQAAFQAHREGDPDLPADKIRRALRQMYAELYRLTSEEAAGPVETFIARWLGGRNGLLVPAGEDTFAVPHKSFREFMAARYLRQNVVDEEEWKMSGPALVRADYDTWREVLRFAAGLASLPEVAHALNELCPDAPSTDPVAVRQLLLSGEIARDMGGRAISSKGGKTGRQVYVRLERHLLHLMRDTGES